MNPRSQQENPRSREVDQGRTRRFNDPQGPGETAEPDGQFPDDDPKVGTIERAPGEDPVVDTDPNAEDMSLTEDPDGIEKVGGLRREDQ